MSHDYFLVLIGLSLSPVMGLAPGSAVSPALDSIIGSAFNIIVSLTSGILVGLVNGVIACHVFFVVIDPTKSIYFYEKKVTVKYLISLKL